MKSSAALILLVASSAVPLAGRRSSAGDVVRFAAREGLVLTKSFEDTSGLELIDSSNTVIVDGEEQAAEGEDFEMTIEYSSMVVFVDELETVEEGRATKLARTYETLSDDTTYSFAGADAESLEEEEEGDSSLEGKRVVFRWDGEADAYLATFPEGESGDSDLLEDLDGEADYLALLPEGEVKVGDTWEIDVGSWRSIESPGGDLKILTPEDKESGVVDDTEDLLYENLTGQLEARYEGQVEREGRTLARIVLTGALASTFEEEADTSEMEGIDFDKNTEHSEFEFEVSGELLWDIEAGHAAHFRLESQIQFTLTGEQSADFEGTSFEAKFVQVFEGKSVREARFVAGG